MKISREFKIGLVALIAVVLAIWGINFLKGINILTPTEKYYAVYGNVKGLIESAVVNLNGYKVGNVSKIQFEENNLGKIVVEISLGKKIKLPRNTKIVLRSGSLISGSKDVDLMLGDGPGYYEPGDTLPSSVQVELSDYIDPIRAQVESLVRSVDTVMVSLSKLMDKDTRKNLQGTIANLNSATQSLRLSLQPNGSLSSSFSNLSSVTDNLKKSNEDISKVLHNFAAVSDSLNQSDLKKLISHANETFAKTSELFGKINEGEGTAGKLVVNDSLYNNLNSAVASLDSLLIDLKDHPGRYVRVSVFGKKEKY
jgi:phospholipid/cholesterol/gamma-HCH transport system substrate-binding protein